MYKLTIQSYMYDLFDNLSLYVWYCYLQEKMEIIEFIKT